MKLTAEFEDLRDIEAFVKAWAPAFQLGTSIPFPALPAQSVTDIAPLAAPVQTAPVAPVPPVTNVMPPVQTQQPVQTQPSAQSLQQPVQQPQAPVPTTAITYSLDDLARAAMTLMDTGRQADLQQMLSRFGVQSLPELPSAQYGAFATELRAMGAQI